AVRAARAQGGDVHLMYIGSGPLEPACREWVATLGDEERRAFHLLPRQDMGETSRRLAACDLFAQPGTTGLAITHGFACGLPAVAHAHEDHGPEIDYLEHEVNGLLLPDYRHSLVAAFLKFGREPGLLPALADGAVRTTRDRLSPEAQVEGFAGAIDYVRGH